MCQLADFPLSEPMAITNPAQNTDYCGSGSTEYPTPSAGTLYCDGDDGVEFRYSGTLRDGVTESSKNISNDEEGVKYAATRNADTLVESFSLTPNSFHVSTVLTKDTHYTVKVSGLITLTGTTSADGCFLIDATAGTETPTNRLTTDDAAYGSMFFAAATSGEVTYDPSHVYEVLFIGNGDTVTFSLEIGGTGSLSLEIHQRSYTLDITNDAGTTTFFSETRSQPFDDIALTCGTRRRVPSGARLEYQTPDRDVNEPEYEWTGQTFNKAQLPIRYILTDSLGTLVETVNIAPGSTATTTATLTKNKYYTFAASGLITLSPTTSADACFFIDSDAGTTEPSDRLTTNDELFDQMFFNAAENGTVVYDPLHNYSVGYIGNNSTVTFALASGGTGLLTIEIYENNYRLQILKDGDPVTTLFDETRDKPYLNINIACGGDCPTRTSFACECSGNRSCYWDDDAGTISKIFEGSANP